MPESARPSPPSELVSCRICRKEIPLSSALTPQGAEYIGYFCGIECYEEFMAEAEHTPSQPQNAPETQK